MYLAQSWVCARPDNAAKCQGIKFAAHQRLLPWFAICLKLDNLLLIGFSYEWLTIFIGQQQTSGGPQQGYTQSRRVSRSRGFPLVGSRMRWSLGPVPRTRDAVCRHPLCVMASAAEDNCVIFSSRDRVTRWKGR